MKSTAITSADSNVVPRGAIADSLNFRTLEAFDSALKVFTWTPVMEICVARTITTTITHQVQPGHSTTVSKQTDVYLDSL